MDKWKSREYNEVPQKKKLVGDVAQGDGDASSGEDEKRSPTPNLLAPRKGHDGRKNDKEKKK